MTSKEQCSKCTSVNIYADRDLWVCAECGHEWVPSAIEDSGAADDQPGPMVIKDANGNILSDGDSVSVIKDLKIKGASSVVKVGMKIKNIRLIESDDGNNIACRIDGVGAINLKSEFVKKS